MKIILIEDVEKLGHQGDIVEVKAGYARNYLIPKQLAWEATRGNMKRLEQQRKVWEVRQLKAKDQADKLKAVLEEKTLVFEARVGEEGHLYGSVTGSDIASRLKQRDIIVDKRRIGLDEPIKREGSHEVPVKLHRDVEAILKIEVVPEGGKREESVLQEAARKPQESVSEEVPADTESVEASDPEPSAEPTEPAETAADAKEPETEEEMETREEPDSLEIKKSPSADLSSEKSPESTDSPETEPNGDPTTPEKQ